MTVPVQAELLRARPFAVQVGQGGAADHNLAPIDGTTEPDITLAPDSTTGLRTTGFCVGIKAPVIATPAGSPVGGFTLTAWLRSPVGGTWFSFSSLAVLYGALYVTFDVDAAGLYFQISGQTSPGTIDVYLMEQ